MQTQFAARTAPARWLVGSLLAVFAVGTSLSLAPLVAEETSLSASAARLLGDVQYLASDDLEGRGVGTEGLDQAADHIAEEYRRAGLQTDVFDGSPFQEFTVSAQPKLGPQEENRLTLLPPPNGGVDAERASLAPGEDFNVLAIGGSGEFAAPLAFAGYGITAPEHEYDDYHGLDVEGKVVVILRKEPRQSEEAEEFDGAHPSRHALFTTKIENAAEHGAAAVILVNDHHHVKNKIRTEQEAWLKATSELAEKRREFQESGDDSPEAFAQFRGEIEERIEKIQELSKRLDAGPDELLAFEQAGAGGDHPELPVFFCRRAIIEPAVKTSLGASLAEIEQKIDEDLQPRSAPLEGWRAAGQTNVIRRQVKVKNVVGVLEGEGPQADETIIIGAHYDHLGMGGAGSLAPWTRAIHNGADDNASGTAVLLEVARRLAKREQKPARRVVFIAFTGEERGLLGSAHYVKNPPFPLAKTVAMINMDMVGRLDDNKLIVHGAGTAENFESLLDRLNQEHGFELAKKASGYGPSDHTSFYAKEIPVLHLFTGTHSDYHRPSDDYDKVNVEGMRRIADLVEDVVLELAGAAEPPKYVKTRRPETPRRGKWPYFGSIPDYGSDAKGLALQGVAKDGPAAKAGLQEGDVIVEFGDQKITGIEDFAVVLSNHKAGDEVEVKALREGEEMTFTVTLDPPR